MPRIAAIIGIPEGILARRKGEGRLTSDDPSGCFAFREYLKTQWIFFEGDNTNALKWPTNPKKAFENQTPLAYSRTELGAREVENLMCRLEHGILSLDLCRLLGSW